VYIYIYTFFPFFLCNAVGDRLHLEGTNDDSDILQNLNDDGDVCDDIAVHHQKDDDNYEFQ
jgi:hypothetical protein